MEVATRSMEDSEVLNAGRGSYLTEEGTVELDAMIMDGQTLNTGKLQCTLLLNIQCPYKKYSKQPLKSNIFY